MRYPSVRSLLSKLARRGPSNVRLEALRLLGLPDLPEHLPPSPRKPKNHRIVLLKMMATDKRRSAKSRLACVKELLFNIPVGLQLEAEAKR